jgi:hypothetical protein
METDLFNARDLAALLAIRQALDDGRLSGRDLLTAFVAAGLTGASDDPSSTAAARDGHAQRAA